MLGTYMVFVIDLVYQDLAEASQALIVVSHPGYLKLSKHHFLVIFCYLWIGDYCVKYGFR